MFQICMCICFNIILLTNCDLFDRITYIFYVSSFCPLTILFNSILAKQTLDLLVTFILPVSKLVSEFLWMSFLCRLNPNLRRILWKWFQNCGVLRCQISLCFKISVVRLFVIDPSIEAAIQLVPSLEVVVVLLPVSSVRADHHSWGRQ